MTGELLGRIVLSKAGRDKGRRFVVVAIEDDAHGDIGIRKIRERSGEGGSPEGSGR